MDDKEYKFTISPMVEMYYNEDSLYGVYKFNTYDNIPNVERLPFDKDLGISTITGKMQRLTVGMKYECVAIESYNKKYKKWQYEPISIKIQKPDSAEERKKFLQCILTEKQVESILNVYPNIIDMVVNDEVVDVDKIKGVGEKSFKNIKDKILENYILSDVITMLKPYGVTINMIKKLMKSEKNAVLLKQKLRKNPYILTEIKGMGFKKIDKVALQITPALRISEERVRSFISYYLSEIGNSEGHSRVSISQLDKGVSETIGDCILLYNEIIDREISNPMQLHIENNEVGLMKYYKRETNIYNTLVSLNNASCSYNITNDEIDKACKKFAEEKGYELTLEQKSILYALQTDNVVLLTGKAGTGKSSSVDVVLKALNNKNIKLCALSAKAVRRMVETTGVNDAQTIHRLLGFKGDSFDYNKTNPIDTDAIIKDEASMTNSSLFLSLLEAIPLGSKVLIVFDDGQLPPIGVGNVATDLLKSTFKHIELNKVHRQAEDSGILSDGNIIRDGINPIKTPSSNMVRGKLKDMFYMFKTSKEDIFETAIQYFMKSLKSTPIEELSICVPRKENAVNCTTTYNNRIQDLLLGDETKFIQKGEKIFKLGAKLIQKVNNYEKDVVNGEIGFLIDIDKDNNFKVKFDNKIIEYQIKEMDELELAYALTVHSMQGSQVHTVIVIIDMSSYILLSRELLYTAITRASNRCLLITEPKAFDLCIKKKSSKRDTWLQVIINKALSQK